MVFVISAVLELADVVIIAPADVIDAEVVTVVEVEVSVAVEIGVIVEVDGVVVEVIPASAFVTASADAGMLTVVVCPTVVTTPGTSAMAVTGADVVTVMM